MSGGQIRDFTAPTECSMCQTKITWARETGSTGKTSVLELTKPGPRQTSSLITLCDELGGNLRVHIPWGGLPQ